MLGIAQVCGSSLWIWLAAVIGLNALNMLIGVRLAVAYLHYLTMVIQPAAHFEEAHQHLILILLCLQLLLQERSVTKAAKRMNVTPSAVSNRWRSCATGSTIRCL
ncbi:MAG: hypothetical protein ACLR9W_04315 [Enterobacter hormaechei]